MIINGIDTKDISVVVQGAVDTVITKKCLASIRKYLPESEIILSTWKGSVTDRFDFDILLLNDDPLSFPCDSLSYSIPNNINRQLISTQAGIERASRKYILKFRTDFYLKSNSFIEYFGKYEKYNTNWRFFDERILICSLYSRNPRLSFSNLRMAYCPSDFFAFGLADDVKKLYSRNVVSSEADKLYFEIYPEKKNELRYKNALCRFMPEQFIWIGFLETKVDNLCCQHRDDVNRKNIRNTELTFANNFLILSPEELGIDTFKDNLFTKGVPENCFSYSDWKLIYRSYCCRNYLDFVYYLTKTYRQNISYKIKVKNSYFKEKLRKYFLTPKISRFDIQIENTADCYTFDIFDTILLRNVAPSWVPMAQTSVYMAMLLKPFNDSVSVQKISELRDRFIQEEYEKNRAEGLDSEYDIYVVIKKILTFYNISDSQIDNLAEQIVENEVQREMECLSVNEGIFELLEKLKIHRKKIIAISDMYLSRKNIKQILEHFGLCGYFSEVYVSSTYSMVKSSGALFKKVLEENSLSPEKIIHIGNDFNSDVMGAKKNGISCLWYHNRRILREYKIVSDYIMGRTRIDSFIEKKLDLSNKKMAFKNVIQRIAVDINNYVFNMIIQAHINNIECIYFLARDGNLYKTLFEILVERIKLFENLRKINLRILKLPRIDSACLIDVQEPSRVIDRAEKVNPPKCFDLLHVLGVFGILLSEFTSKETALIQENRFNRFFFCENFNKMFEKHFIRRKNHVVKFLTENKLFDYKTIAVADIGWGGTIQNDLMTYLIQNRTEGSLWGFYYANDDRIEKSTVAMKYVQYQDARNLLYGYSFLEFVVKEYTKNAADLKQKLEEQPILKETYEKNWEARQLIIEMADKFSQLINKYSLTVENIYRYSNAFVICLCKNPEKRFVKTLKGVLFSLDRKVGDEYLPLVSKIRRLSAYNYQLSMAQWVQGSFKLNSVLDTLVLLLDIETISKIAKKIIEKIKSFK